MRRGMEVQGAGLIRLLRHNPQPVQLYRSQGQVIVHIFRSWLHKQKGMIRDNRLSAIIPKH